MNGSISRGRATVVAEIFPGVEWSGEVTEDEMYYLQVQYLSMNSGPSVIQHLISKYSVDPKLVVSTILLVHGDLSLCSLDVFPYNLILDLLERRHRLSSDLDSICCIQDICGKSQEIFLNLLYRIAFSATFKNIQKCLDRLEILLSFGECKSIFTDRRIWGLKRTRIGVSGRDDAMVERHIMCSDLDITEINDLKVLYFRNMFERVGDDSTLVNFYMNVGKKKRSGDDNTESSDSSANDDAPEDRASVEAMIERIRSLPISEIERKQRILASRPDIVFKATGEYQWPCFLEPILSIFPDNPILKGAEIKSLHAFYETLANLIVPLIKDLGIKAHFTDMITNVCAQDRGKMVFDPKCLRCDRASSYNDQRHRFVLSGIWTLNYANNLSSVPKAILGGWEISAILTAQSGQPYFGLVSGDPNGDGNNFTDRLTTQGRDQFVLPATWSLDPRFAKSINFSERAKLQLFVEAFNIFNHFNVPAVKPTEYVFNSTTLLLTPQLTGVNAFGLPTTPGGGSNYPFAGPGQLNGARIFQLGARVSF